MTRQGSIIITTTTTANLRTNRVTTTANLRTNSRSYPHGVVEGDPRQVLLTVADDAAATHLMRQTNRNHRSVMIRPIETTGR